MGRLNDIKRSQFTHRPAPKVLEEAMKSVNVYAFDYEVHQGEQRIPGSVKVAAETQDEARSAVLQHGMDAYPEAQGVHLKNGGSVLLTGVDLVVGELGASAFKKAIAFARDEAKRFKNEVALLEAKVKALEADLAAKAEQLAAKVEAKV